jgi:hypothetical protein
VSQGALTVARDVRTTCRGRNVQFARPGFRITRLLYFLIKLASNEFVAIRNDFLDDPRGWRTGFATGYTSHTLGWVHQFNRLFEIRPEIRYERSYVDGVTPYDNGSKKNQFTASADAIVRF